MIARLWVAAGLVAAAVPAPEPVFAVGRLVADLPGTAVIGRAKSGLICGPAGPLRWRDAAPALTEASHRAAAAMRQAGLDVAVPDPDVSIGEDERTPMELVPTLAALRMDACTAWRGIRLSSGQGSVKASGRAIVVWRAYERRSRLIRSKVTVCANFKVDRDAPTIDRATEDAIASTGVAAVPLLTAAAASAASPLIGQQLGCTPAELTALDKI